AGILLLTRLAVSQVAISTFHNAVDAGGATGDWHMLGSWTIPAGQQPPTVLSVTPNSGNGTSQSFDFEYSDSSGYTTLDTVYAYVGNGGLANSCYVYYTVSNNTLLLLNDAGTSAAGAARPGTTTILQNSQCSVNVGASTASGVGTNLTLH